MKIIIGLGNPGEQYENTRHNLGWRVIELLAKRHDAPRARRKYRSYAQTAKFGARHVLLLRPRTFVNLSGRAVASAVAAEKIRPEELIVVSDDIHLDVGCIRIRKRGSAGGHNGLASIVEYLGTQDWPRIRIGVGQPKNEREKKDYVLSEPAEEESHLLERSIEDAADALEMWATRGIEQCMNSFNSKGRNSS